MRAREDHIVPYEQFTAACVRADTSEGARAGRGTDGRALITSATLMLGSRAAILLVAFSFGCHSDGGGTAVGDSTGTTAAGSTTTTAGSSDAASDSGGGTPIDPESLGHSCVVVRGGDTWLARSGDGFGFSATAAADATSFHLQPSDLATYLLYDAERGYLVAEDGPLLRQTQLESDLTRVDDAYVSGAEWIVEPAAGATVHLRNRRTDRLLGASGLVDDEASALAIALDAGDGCTDHPELTLDATGAPTKTTFDDGTVYGIVDTHSHILSNFGFGGGGIFHGAPFHRLGVEHALADCAPFHGENGRKDFFGYAFDSAGADGADIASVIPDLIAGSLSVDAHATAGYPTFTEWPSAPTRSTHQMQYYKWLERAWLGGLRLVVQHATTNSAICHMIAGQGLQPVRYSCEDMVAVDRIIDETYALERYIDAQSGGSGKGWFRVVTTPADAREVIAAGKLAVVLGIETSDLFDCRLVPREGGPTCDADFLRAQLDAYRDRGVRAVFPVHKYDNAFGPGDGDRAFIELGNFFNSGHWSNFTQECPVERPARFDNGDVQFGGLNMPREQFDAPPPIDFSNFPGAPLATALPYINAISAPALVGDYCQNATMTTLGETLMREMMLRGMIIEIDHLPQWSYQRAFELLEENDYPAVGSHGGTYDGRLYELGGVSKTGLGECREDTPGAMTQRLRDRIEQIVAHGGYPAEGFGFDLNGFAGAPGGRFEAGACATAQADPVTYPFTSFAGDVEFTQPMLGERVVDYANEGFVHIGMLPEMLEDARRDATSDDDLEPLFHSAEGYLRMWERAEQRASELQ